MTQPTIIDTREPSEFAASHVSGAINIPPHEFMKDSVPHELIAVPKDQQIIVYCRSGQRSNTCGMILRNHGFTNITNGINEHHVAKMVS